MSDLLHRHHARLRRKVFVHIDRVMQRLREDWRRRYAGQINPTPSSLRECEDSEL